MDLQLKNKLALVSGSTAGIGFAIAAGLAAEGARVIVNGRTEGRVQEAMAKLRAAQPAALLEALPLDLSTAEGATEAARRFPSVEILVNNLGIFEPKAFQEIPDEDWRRLFEVNVLSGVRLTRAYLPGMKQRNWGRIIFISSESGMQVPPEMVHYGLTKSSQLFLSRAVAEMCAGTKVTCNAVLPGPTASEGVKEFVGTLAKQGSQTPEEVEKEFFERARTTSLLRRFAAPEEVATMVTYLCSPLASATNGAAVRVDGGLVRSPY